LTKGFARQRSKIKKKNKILSSVRLAKHDNDFLHKELVLTGDKFFPEVKLLNFNRQRKYEKYDVSNQFRPRFKARRPQSKMAELFHTSTL